MSNGSQAFCDDFVDDGIAVIGMACRFPGAKDVSSFWKNLCKGVESITFYTDEELREEGISEKVLRDKNYVKAEGTLTGSELFDAAFFGFTPKEAQFMDPQHRIFLEVCWEALEHSGQSADKYEGSVGIFGGCGTNNYLIKKLLASSDLSSVGEFQTIVGNDKDFLTTRISYKMDLKGPSLDIQTACSTSLVAVHFACLNLLNYQCDTALAGGVFLKIPHRTGYYYQDGHIFSADGHCRAFDAKAQGTVFGEGAGVVVLKRLDEAVKDGNTIYAIIRGSAVNNDGANKVGYTAPSLDGQAQVVAAAQAVAGVQPDTVSYIETHGTGTRLGDSIEIAALKRVFQPKPGVLHRCGIGSVKTNIGHLDVAAGIAGFIKTVLALYHKQLPASLHFQKSNPELGLEGSPFYVVSSHSEWIREDTPRRAGVSAFGVGGTNAHVVLEEAPDGDEVPESRRPVHLLPVSAKTSSALNEMLVNLKLFFEKNPETDLADAAFTLSSGRRTFQYRYAVACRTLSDFIEKTNCDPTVIEDCSKSEKRIVFMFPGEASFRFGETAELYKYEPVFRDCMNSCAAFFVRESGFDIRQILYQSADCDTFGRKMPRSSVIQAALFSVEYSLSQMWMKRGIMPDCLVGYGIGEYVAACIAGVFCLDDALKIVNHCGRLLDKVSDGAMIAVEASPDMVAQHIREDCLDIAAVNTPWHCVVSGDAKQIDSFQNYFVDKYPEICIRRLDVSCAFNSRLMKSVQESLAAAFLPLCLHPAAVPIISSASGGWVTESQAMDPTYWAKQIAQPVLFADVLSELRKSGLKIFLEVGFGNLLASYICSSCKEGDVVDIYTSLPDESEYLSEMTHSMDVLGKLWSSGVDLNLNAIYAGEKRKRIALPTYPFEKQRCWVDESFDFYENVFRKEALFFEKDQDLFKTGYAANSKEPFDSKLAREYVTPLEAFAVYSQPNGRQADGTVSIIRRVWQQLLGVNDVADNDDFFDLGGHSLLASQVSTRLSRLLDMDIPGDFIFEYSTISELAREIDQNRLSQLKSSLEVIQKKIFSNSRPLSPAQNRIWFLCQLEPHNTAFNIVQAVKLTGHVEVAILQKAFDEICARHEILRTVFQSDQGKPCARLTDIDSVPIEVIKLQEDEVFLEKAGEIIKQQAPKLFNLEKGPLFRPLLITNSSAEAVFTFICHHIISDGWSMGVWTAELAVLYETFSAGGLLAIEKPEIQYADYVEWINEIEAQKDFSQEIAYWKQVLGMNPAPLQLHTDFPRPVKPSTTGSLVHFQLKGELTSCLKKWARSEDVTLFSVLLTGFMILLHKYTGDERIIVGAPFAGRSRIEFEGLIGLFLNMLPLCGTVADTDSPSDLVLRIYEVVHNASAHQNISFSRIVDELKPERSLDIPPVFQVMFAFQNFPLSKIRMKNLTMETIFPDRGSSEYDLAIYMWEEGGSAQGVFEYRSDLFYSETIRRMSEHFENILEIMSAVPDCVIGRMDILLPAERDLLMGKWNDTSVNRTELCCIHELFEKQCQVCDSASAVVSDAGMMTYAELNKKANQLAYYMISLGIAPNNHIGVCLERNNHIPVVLLAILKAGCAYVPIDPEYPRDRIAYMLDDAGISLLIVQSETVDVLPDCNCQKIIIDQERDMISECRVETIPTTVSGDSLAYIIYTSGSTGKPKGVRIPHKAVVNFLASMSRLPGCSAGDVLLAVTTISFDIHVLEIFLPLSTGASLVIVSRETASDGAALAKALKKYNPTIMQATPSTWRLLLAGKWDGSDRLKVLCGGEAFPRDLAEQLLSRVSQVWNMYGPTETTVWSTCCRLVNVQGPILIGRPIDNTRLYVLDRNMQPVPAGVPGELFIGGLGLAEGYHNRPELTKERFMTDPFIGNENDRIYRTGDLVRYCPDGNMEYIERIDNQVKIRGFRIELEEVESVMSDVSGIAGSAVVVRERRPGDKMIVAYYVPQHGDVPSVAAVRKALQEKLPAYMVPNRFVELDAFPLTPAGKIDKRNLPAPPDETSDNTELLKKISRESVEFQLAAIWQQILGHKEIGLQDNFFDIGGHSLLAVDLFKRIEKRFGVNLPLATLFQAPTIEKLSEILRDSGWKANWSSLVPIHENGSKIPLFLIHGAGGNVLLYRDLSRYLGSDQPVYGLQARGLDGREEIVTNVEQMAANYIREIRSVQPEGPYQVGGYCLGGTIAYEIARQLENMDQQVSLVALFDTHRQWENFGVVQRLKFLVDNVGFHLGNIIKAGGAGRFLFFKERFLEALRRMHRRYDVVVSDMAYALGYKKRPHLVIMERINDRAAIEYQAKPYGGRITLFRPSMQYFHFNDPLYGWGGVETGGVEVVELSVYPNGMLVEPFVRELAAELALKMEDDFSVPSGNESKV